MSKAASRMDAIMKEMEAMMESIRKRHKCSRYEAREKLVQCALAVALGDEYKHSKEK